MTWHQFVLEVKRAEGEQEMRKDLPLGASFVAHYLFKLIVPLPYKLWSASQEVCDPWDEIIRIHTCISSSFLPWNGDWIVLKAVEKKKNSPHSTARFIQVRVSPLQDVNNYSAILGLICKRKWGPMFHEQGRWSGPRQDSWVSSWYEMSLLLVYNHWGPQAYSS